MNIACFRKRMSDRPTCMGTWLLNKLVRHNSFPGRELEGYASKVAYGSQNALYKHAYGLKITKNKEKNE